MRSPFALEGTPTPPFRGVAEHLVRTNLARLGPGVLAVTQANRRERYGRAAVDGLAASITVERERVWNRLLLGGTLGAARAFIDGDFTTDDLVSVVRVLVRNRQVMGVIDSGLGRLLAAASRPLHALRRNTVAGSRRNIVHHYDLGNDFFALMLDPTMTYSAAIFADGDDLEAASRRKLDRLCQRLALDADQHLLEIGTGWGSLAMHAATHYGCRVTTTTISPAQRALAEQRIRAAGLADRITVLDVDYRQLRGRFDKIVSCEMIEAVGAEFTPTFFAICDALLAPGGRLVMQAITMPDAEYARAASEVDFIKRYIFPGSCIPSVASLCSAAARASTLRPSQLDDHTSHYGTTLAAWRDNLAPHRAQVIARHGERFWRTWAYYLAYCEGGFRERYLGLVHLTFDKPQGPA